MIEPLPDGCKIEESGEWHKLTTPFLDPSFDYMQIYIKEGDNGYVLADMTDCDGYLWLNGYKLHKQPKIRAFIEHVLAGTHIIIGEFGLSTVSKDKSREAFLNSYHALIQTMITIQSYVVYRRVYAK